MSKEGNPMNPGAVAWLAGVACLLGAAGGASGAPAGERIKAFCIDFNWSGGRFAEPGTFAHASAAEHAAWYSDLGVNTIQTFCVSCDGYAWFRGGVAPVQPGMKGDFLKDLTALGHQNGMKVMGYFCIGANTHWGKTHPELSHGAPGNTWHIPLSTPYLDYLCASIRDALACTGIDGFMVDWVWEVDPKWIACEKTMYQELFGEPFPAAGTVTAEKAADFKRRAVDRAWGRIREAAKSAHSGCVIWLSCFNLNDPQVKDSRMFREIDWLMNEHPDFASLEAARKAAGPRTKIVQCVCGWGAQHNTAHIIRSLGPQDVGFYGFAEPDVKTTLPPPESANAHLAGNALNIQRMRDAFHGIRLVARPGADGRIVLKARDAETHGPTPAYAGTDGNNHIGWWGDPKDYVSWAFEASRAGAYAVQVVYSCDAGAGGSAFAVSIGGLSLAGTTRETGSWKTYAPQDLGTIRLDTAGEHTLAVKPQTPPPWKVMGLQAVILRPADLKEGDR
jgi:hypothetical protein